VRNKRRSRRREKKRRKIAAWNFYATLSLILGAMGASGFITSRPQISVSPQDATDYTSPASSTSYRIANTGYVDFKVVHVYSYIHVMRAGSMVLEKSVALESEGSEFTPGEAETITPRWFRGKIPDEFDMAIVVDYKKFGLAFRKYFRFKRFEGPYSGTWNWNEQPVDDMKPEIDEQIAEFDREYLAKRPGESQISPFPARRE
jgi:hypothetical protein